VETDPDLDAWERHRRGTLADLVNALGGNHLDLDTNPQAFLPILSQFLADQDYSTMEEEDEIWLKTAVTAYIAQVLMVQYPLHWEVHTDERGRNHLLVMTDPDGQRHGVSPLDVVYDDFTQPPPILVRMLATAERTAQLVTEPPD
jgi:hypothetical protein